jgi:hypothetical protein
MRASGSCSRRLLYRGCASDRTGQGTFMGCCSQSLLDCASNTEEN